MLLGNKDLDIEKVLLNMLKVRVMVFYRFSNFFLVGF